ncbi:MAG: Arc family DNA-binding protein [Candidatus Competibacter denitrificans]
MKMTDKRRLSVSMPLEIQEWLRQQATAHRRSMNGELTVCLEEARKLREAETVKPQRVQDARASDAAKLSSNL